MRVLSPSVRERSKKAEMRAQRKREKLEQEKSLRSRSRHTYGARKHSDRSNRFYHRFDRMNVGIILALICLAALFFSIAYARSEASAIPPVRQAKEMLANCLEALKSSLGSCSISKSFSAGAVNGSCQFRQSTNTFYESDVRINDSIVYWAFSRK